MQVSCRWTETVDVPAFIKAWQSVARRHPTLRVSFRWEGVSEPVQDVHRAANIPLLQQDWSHLEREAQRERLQAYLVSDRRQGFEASQAPLLRMALFRLAEAEYDLVLTVHHAVLDGWSVNLALKEVFDSYESYCRGEEPQFHGFPPPYRDYVDWSRQLDLSPAELFWRTLLQGFIVPTRLVADQPAGSEPLPANYGEQDVRLSPATTNALRALVARYDLTLNTLIEGAWAALLSRYTGEQDVVFGATWGCRHSPVCGTEHMIGALANALPVRARMQPDSPVLELLQGLRRQHLQAREFQHTPLARVQGWSELPGGMALFETVITFHNHSYDRVFRYRPEVWPDREFHFYPNLGTAINLRVYDEPELLIKLVYDGNRFSDNASGLILGHVRTLLEGMAANPEQSIAALPVLTEAEERQLLVEWNKTDADYPRDKCIHQLFEEKAAQTPKHVALLFNDQRLTYGELNRRANRLAHYLRRQGVSPEALVGICMERSVEMMVGVLGVLKAGGAYVPLDPAYPKERLEFLLTDTQAHFLLTQKSVMPVLPGHGAQAVYLDEDWGLIGQESTENPDSVTGPDNLAYVIYTSGSTGTPKGVMVSHRGLCNASEAYVRNLGLGPRDRVAQFAPLSFDASVAEMIMAWAAGATLCLGTREQLLPGPGLLRFLRKWKITVVTIPPSSLAMVPYGDLPALHTMCVAGEACSTELVKRWAGRRRFINLYGPTEASIWATFARCNDDERVPPIGRPIQNVRTYILDAHLKPVPAGAVGELHIGGIGLARGYFHRPDLTTQKFISNPLPHEPGARLYKTGDLARYRPDGNIEFLGRADHQVKLRGFRIELGEIETHLREHPGIDACVALIRDDRDNTTRLVAYCVPKAGAIVQQSEVRSYMKERLPDYMVPSAFIMLEALPLTPNGKVDSRALPAPDVAGREPSDRSVAPRTPVERSLASIWMEVLRVQQVGVYDDFFELGGTSLQYFSVLNRIEREFGKTLTVAALRRAATIEQLAHVIVRPDGSPDLFREAPRWKQMLHNLLAKGRRAFASPKKAYSAVWRRVYERVVHAGPVFGKIAFPYATGMKMLAWLSGRRFTQAMFSYRLRPVRQGLPLILGAGGMDMAGVIRQSLTSNVWNVWRVIALSRLGPGQFDRWVTVTGASFLEEACREGRGVVLVSSHAHVRRIVPWILHRAGHDEWGAVSYIRDDGSFEGMGLRDAVQNSLPRRMLPEGSYFSIQLYKAKQVLGRGGIIFVAADAPVGSSPGIRLPFLGRHLDFRKGFAELALSAAAPVIPVRASIDTTGHVTVRFLPRMKVAGASHEEQVESLVRQYVDGLSKEWIEEFGNINWVYLRMFLARPLIAAKTGARSQGSLVR